MISPFNPLVMAGFTPAGIEIMRGPAFPTLEDEVRNYVGEYSQGTSEIRRKSWDRELYQEVKPLESPSFNLSSRVKHLIDIHERNSIEMNIFKANTLSQ